MEISGIEKFLFKKEKASLGKILGYCLKAFTPIQMRDLFPTQKQSHQITW
jgi:hypothetical protein